MNSTYTVGFYRGSQGENMKIQAANIKDAYEKAEALFKAANDPVEITGIIKVTR